MESKIVRQNGFHARVGLLPPGPLENAIPPPSPVVKFRYPSPAQSANPSRNMGQPSSLMPKNDPFFFTPRQLAEHLLLTYPQDYKVSPTQLKHSIILGNDVSGKVFLSAILRPNDLESMLGVGTLGARVWLWDEMTKMRRVSRGYSDWKKEKEAEKKAEKKAEKEAEAEEEERARGSLQVSPVTAGGAKRRRAIESSSAESVSAKRQAMARRWAAVRTGPIPVNTDPTPESDSDSLAFCSDISVKKQEEEDEEGEDLSFIPSSQSTTMATVTSAPTIRTESTDWDSDFQEVPPRPLPRPKGKLLKGKGNLSKKRALRPRSYNLQHLKTKLVDILDPENLEVSEITIMLHAIREIPETDLYEEFIRAAKVTAGERGLPPSLLAMREDKKTVTFVHEMAAVYCSWILSKPYPLESLGPTDVERMAVFDFFLQFKVQFLNLLIPYENRRRSSSYASNNLRLYRTPTPTPIPTPVPTTIQTPVATVNSKRHWRQAKPNLVTSDLPPSTENTDRCPETGWSSRQRKWGETVVRKYRDSNKLRPNLKPHWHQRLTKHKHRREDELEDLVQEGESADGFVLTNRSEDPVPWGVNYVQGSLTPEGLQAFVDWASGEDGKTLFLWKYLKPKAYAEFVNKFSNMESQLTDGIAKLGELRRMQETRKALGLGDR